MPDGELVGYVYPGAGPAIKTVTPGQFAQLQSELMENSIPIEATSSKPKTGRKMTMTDSDRPQQLKTIIKRASIAYAGAIAMVVFTVIYSIAHQAGWTPALAGLPLYITMFVAITYKLVTDIRERRKVIKELGLGCDVQR